VQPHLENNIHHPLAVGLLIFYGVNPERPSAEGDFLRWGLKSAMEAAGIDYKARKIVFHSHRHFYCARLADRMSAEEVSRISGHKSKIMFEHYADHVIDENVLAVGRAGAEVFGKILPFTKKKGA
jgi:integrase